MLKYRLKTRFFSGAKCEIGCLQIKFRSFLRKIPYTRTMPLTACFGSVWSQCRVVSSTSRKDRHFTQSCINHLECSVPQICIHQRSLFYRVVMTANDKIKHESRKIFSVKQHHKRNRLQQLLILQLFAVLTCITLRFCCTCSISNIFTRGSDDG